MVIPILTFLVFSPLAFALGVWIFSDHDVHKTRLIALSGTLWTLIIAFVGVLLRYRVSLSGLQFEEKAVWIKSIHAYYHLGIDGLSLAMVLLVSLISVFVVLAAWKRTADVKNFYGLILLEEFGLLGSFMALDFVHWFIFWEFSLIPMFFLIKFFGHEGKTAAANKFFIYTMVGSIFLVLGFQFIYLATGSWNFITLAEKARTGVLYAQLQDHWNAIRAVTDHPQSTFNGVIWFFQAVGSGIWTVLYPLRWFLNQFIGVWMGYEFPAMSFPLVICLFVMAGFAVKVPLWPFHTWLPDAYTQAPTGGSILMAALMSKMGVYGFLRIVLPLFHDSLQVLIIPLCWLALGSILFGALAAYAQRDLKTLIAYSSVSHLGYCMLGIFIVTASWQVPEDRILALNGVIFQMIAHGLSVAGLFYFAGLLEKRTLALMSSPAFRAIDSRAIDTYGGIRKTVPVLTGLMGITIFASLGLPGLCGFVGEFMIFKGSFSGSILMWFFVALAAVGLLLTAIYLLTMVQKVFFGPQDPKWDKLPDLRGSELWLASVPLVLLMFVLGIYPQCLVVLSNATIMNLAKMFS